MGAFLYWLITVPFLVILVLYDMIMATMGKSRMDKFKKNWYSK